MTKIPGLQVFPYIVEEAKGSNSKFIFFSVPHLAGGLWEHYLRGKECHIFIFCQNHNLFINWWKTSNAKLQNTHQHQYFDLFVCLSLWCTSDINHMLHYNMLIIPSDQSDCWYSKDVLVKPGILVLYLKCLMSCVFLSLVLYFRV